MSIVSIAASKDHLYLVMTTPEKADFEVIQHHRIPLDSSNWASLVADLSTHLGAYNAENAIKVFAIVCCASGMYGASPEAFKAEGFAELKCQEIGHPISQITKQSLKKHLGCHSGQKWQAVAKDLFNTDKKISYFSCGFDAAISGAYGVAT